MTKAKCNAASFWICGEPCQTLYQSQQRTPAHLEQGQTAEVITLGALDVEISQPSASTLRKEQQHDWVLAIEFTFFVMTTFILVSGFIAHIIKYLKIVAPNMVCGAQSRDELDRAGTHQDRCVRACEGRGIDIEGDFPNAGCLRHEDGAEDERRHPRACFLHQCRDCQHLHAPAEGKYFPVSFL